MSVTIGDTQLVESCEHCGDMFKVQDSPRPNHCSHDCYYTDKGKGALNQLESDHKICATCFRSIKTVQAPEESWVQEKQDLEKLLTDHGGEYTSGPNGNVELDATSVTTSKRTTASDVVIGYQYPTKHTTYLYGTSGPWTCQCGTVDTHSRDDILTELDLEVTVSMLLKRLTELGQKEAIADVPDRNVFREAFDPKELNFEYAVGKAVFES